MKDLGTLPGDLISAGIAINDPSEVVGVSLDAASNLRRTIASGRFQLKDTARLLQQQLGSWRLGKWLAPPR